MNNNYKPNCEMDSFMDNCSFLKKDLDAARLHGHLYVFKYLVKKDGMNYATNKICVRGETKDDAEKDAIGRIIAIWGSDKEVEIIKWIELRS